MTKKLSLCVIAGNVEHHIERFLDSFHGVADEIILVQAVGNQPNDSTKRIAQERGCSTAVYLNDTSESRDWPHVDDFAAARNTACDMATGDFLMWADTDDIITPESIAQIRQLIQQIPDDIDGVLMPYVVPEDGVINWRERIWRKGSARWVNPIHECLQFRDGAQSIRFPHAEIVHASEKRHASRDERNLRILESIPEADRSVSQKFHIFQSLIALDRDAEAIPLAVDFIQIPDVGKNERYEAFFQLARLADSEDVKKSMLLQALATDPSRREAYGELGLACVPSDPDAALGWTESMMALTIPAEAPWNLRRAYYGKLGVSLRAMALRRAGRPEEGDAIETNHFIRNGAKISLLHATRGRPAKAWRTRMDWLRLAENPDAIEHIFALDADDPGAAPLATSRCVITEGNGGPVAAWNAAAKASKGAVLVQLSDDFEAFPGWDTAILSAIGDTAKSSVLAVSDGHRTDDLLCMAILTRARYQEQGYLFHPEFFSMCSDDWFTHCAHRDEVIIDCRDRITFEHMHPAFGKGENDATYARSNAAYHYQTGRGIFERLRAGVKVSADIDGWFDFRDFYDYVAQTIDGVETFVEVGCWKGKSFLYLAHRIEDIGKHNAVIGFDTFEGDNDTGKQSVFDEFEGNMRDGKRGVFVGYRKAESIAAAEGINDGSLAGVFIDAAHDYESVKADIAAWLPKVKRGGIFAGHDIDSHGVLQAVQEAGFEFEIRGRVWVRKN